MTEEQKKQTTNVEGVQEMIRKVVNKTGGNVCSCSTAGNTAAKEVTLGPSFELVAGAVIVITFVNGITVGGATLAVTHTDLAGTTTTEAAKPIYYRGAALGANLVKAGSQVILRYNGTQFCVIGDLTPSGFAISYDTTTGRRIITAIGSASVSHDDVNGRTVFTY